MARDGQGRGRRLAVVPDADRLEDALVRAAAGARGFADGNGFITWAQLLDRLGADRLGDRRPCTPTGSRVILWAAARELGEGPFGAFAEEPAFARATMELVSQLKGAGIAPDAFAQATEQLAPARRERARYLARLYAAYDRKLHDARAYDREDRGRAAILRLEKGDCPRVLAGVSEVVVRAMHDFPLLRQEVLLALARRCERERIAFHLEVPAAGAKDIDAAVDPVLGAFERLGADLGHVDARKAVLLDDGAHPLAALEKSLFSASAAARSASGLGELIDVWSAATPRDEARLIAHGVARCLEQGDAPDELAVVLRDPGEDAALILEELDALGIPARNRQGGAIAATAAGRLALELPMLPEDDYPAREVARVLVSPYATGLTEGCPDRPAALLGLASVRDDRLGAEPPRGAYTVRLERYAARVEKRGDARGAREARALLAACQRLFAVCGAIPAEGPAAVLLERWWAAVEALGLPQAVVRSEGRGDESTRFGRARLWATARDQAAMEALTAMKLELARALTDARLGDATVTRRAFHRWLLDAADDVGLPPRGPRAGAVRVGEVRELVGRSMQRVFVAGLVDGRFPGRPTPNPLLSDEDQRLVNATLGKPVFRLTTGELDGRAPWRLAEDRLLFFLSLACARGGVSLSYARRADGQEQLRSPFLDELERVTGAGVRAVGPTPVPPLDAVRTEEELRARAALEALARTELRITAPDKAGPELQRRLAHEPWFGAAEALSRIEEERLRAAADEQRPPTPFTGLVGTPELAEALEAAFRFDAEHPLSASALDTYGNCAFQGFLKHALRLGEPDAPGEEIDARGQGSFWHKVLEVLFPRLAEQGLLGKPPEALPDALLDAALEAAATEAEQSSHVGHPAVWRLGRERARGMVRRLLAAEVRGLPFEGFVPAKVELRFGRKESPAGWQQVAIPGGEGGPPIHLEGKIDRVDQGGGGAVAIVDYKSSRVRNSKELREKLLAADFQLPLYLYAARKAGHAGAVHAAWLSMRDGDATRLEEVHQGLIEELLSDDPAVQARVALAGGKNLVAAVRALVAELRAGRFAAHPHDCEYCPYRAVCRVGDRKLEADA